MKLSEYAKRTMDCIPKKKLFYIVATGILGLCLYGYYDLSRIRNESEELIKISELTRQESREIIKDVKMKIKERGSRLDEMDKYLDKYLDWYNKLNERMGNPNLN